MFSTLKLAARNVAQHRRRSLLVGTAIGAVVLFVTLTLAALNATRIHLYDLATSLSSGDIDIDGVQKPTPGRAVPVLADAARIEALVKAHFPEVDTVVHRRLGILNVASGQASREGLLAVGVDISKEPALGRAVVLEQGRLADLDRPGGVVISANRARQLHVRLGDPVTLTAVNHKRAYNAIDAQVVGIAPNVGGVMDMLTLASLDTVGRLFGFQPGEYTALDLHLRDRDADLVALQDRLQRTLTAASVKLLDHDQAGPWLFTKEQLESQPWFGERALVARWDEEEGPQALVLTALNVLLGLVTLILLMVASVGLMNALWLAIRERTSEIGTLRAMGMRRGAVIRLFLSEAFLLALLGTGMGVLAGVLAGAVLNRVNIPIPEVFQWTVGMGAHLRFTTDAASLAVAAGLIVGATTLVAIFPSYLASRIQPITAMQRTE